MNQIFKYFLVIIVPQQILGLMALIYLWYSQEFIWLIATFISWFLCYVVGEGIFLHRYFAHRTFECHPFWPKLFGLMAMLGGHVNPINFRIVHNAHHVHADTEKDPHTPKYSFFSGFVGWYWMFEFKDAKKFLLSSRHLTSDPYYVFLMHQKTKIWWGAIILLTLIDFRLGLFTMGLAGSIGILLTCITNSFGHRFGSRRYNTPDNSTNNAWFSWLCWQGSGALQNNHHAFPLRYHDSHAWYEFDVAKWIEIGRAHV